MTATRDQINAENLLASFNEIKKLAVNTSSEEQAKERLQSLSDLIKSDMARFPRSQYGVVLNIINDTLKAQNRDSRTSAIEKLAAVNREIRLHSSLVNDQLNVYKQMDDLIKFFEVQQQKYISAGRTNHLQDFINIREQLTRLRSIAMQPNNTEPQNQLSAMVKILEAAFVKEQKNNAQFAEKLNKNQNEYHYPRLLAELIRYIDKNQTTQVISPIILAEVKKNIHARSLG